MNKHRNLPTSVRKQIELISSQIISLKSINKKDLEKAFSLERDRLTDLGLNPSVKYMYHLTSTESANLIKEKGFKPNFSYYKAFGRGVNLCPKIEDVLKYRRMRKSDSKRVSIIVAKVLIGKAHANSSDDEHIIREENGAVYSKPKYMKPKRGHDCMYSAEPLKQVWIIPSGKRVIPVMEIEIADS